MEASVLHKIRVVAAFLMAFLSFQIVNSQTIGTPGPPSDFICASTGNSDWVITSDYSGDFPNTTTFTLLLSDVLGNFDTSSTELATIGIDNASQELVFNIDISEITEFSDAYKFKVVSNQGIESRASDSIPIYFASNERLVSRPTCLYGVDGEITAQFDADAYVWYYKEDLGSSEFNGVVIEGETSRVLKATRIGRYYYQLVDFGECSSRVAQRSNFSDVNPDDAGSQVTITKDPPAGSVCDDATVTFTATEVDGLNFYQWTKDGVNLDNVISSDFTVTGANALVLTVTGIGMEGSYRVDVKEGPASNDCSIQSNTIDLELKNPKISIISDLSVVLLPPGEPKIIVADIERGDSGIEVTWFKDGVEQSSGTDVEFEATEAGIYTVSLTADTECDINTVFADEEVVVVEAGDFNIEIAYLTQNYQDCEFSEVELTVFEITTSVNGQTVILDTASLGSVEFDWLKDGESTGETGQNITIDSASDNGVYTVAILDDVSVNSLPVVLSLDSFEITKNPEVLASGETVELSLGITDTDGYSFQWFSNGSEIAGETDETYFADEPGLYAVEISFEDCGTNRAQVVLNTGSLVIPSIITPNADGVNDDWVLPTDLSLNDSVEVSIYASSGELDYSTTGYDGEWPSESLSSGIGTIYYYVISRNNSPVEQGSITIIR